MFGNKILSILLPVLVSTLLYLLFIMLGVAEDKMNIIIATPIISVFWFFGAFLIVYIQVKNKKHTVKERNRKALPEHPSCLATENYDF